MNTLKKQAFFWAAFCCFCLPAVVNAAAPPLRLLLIPMKSPTRMYKDFLPLKHYLEQKLRRPMVLKVARRNSEIAALFRAKKIDIAFVCPTLYCTLTKALPMSPLVKLRLNGRDYYRSVLVVRDDSKIRRTAELLGKTMVYGRYNCPGSGLLPRIMLQRVGLTNDKFFEVVKLGNDESALLAVMARMFDVTGVPEMAARSFIGSGLRVIRYSEAIPQYLFTARSGLGTALIGRIKAAMLALNQAPDRKNIIGGLEKGVDGFSPALDSDYDIVRVLSESLKRRGNGALFRPGEHTLVVEPLYYDADIFGRLKPLLTSLRLETGWNYHLRIPGSMAAFMELAKHGRGDLFLREAGFLASLGKPPLEDLGTLALLPPELNIGLIITNSRNGVKDLAGLRGRKIGIPSRFSEGGYKAQTRWLRQHGVPPGSARLISLGTCEQVLMSVYRGEVAAGYITLDTLRRLRDDIVVRRIVILGRTPPLSDWLLSASKAVPGFVKNKVKKILAGQ
ncbi:phosphate/phosphite/phosphonate ABC transporter substrate-binding protein [Desulfobacterota bacterium M19]